MRSDGLAGWAASSTAGAAVAVPLAIAEVNPAFAPMANSATAIVATCVLVSAVLTPMVTMWYYKRLMAKQPQSVVVEPQAKLTPSENEGTQTID